MGDLYPEIRNVWALFRNKEVIRNTFDVILDQIREDGFIPASSISMQVFYEYNCWFLIVLEDCKLFLFYDALNLGKFGICAQFVQTGLIFHLHSGLQGCQIQFHGTEARAGTQSDPANAAVPDSLSGSRAYFRCCRCT